MAMQIVILAAGQGKRMYSNQPKVLHKLAGKPLLEHVIRTALSIAPDSTPIIIYGHQGDLVSKELAHFDSRWVEQKQQLGTGHALQQALPEIAEQDRVLVLNGDVPLISETSLKKLIAATPENALGMLTTHLDSPTGYGRIKRDKNQNIVGIVEEKDASPEEKQIKEINPGIYLVPANYLKKWLPTLKNHNAQGEYYVTDIISLAVAEKIPVYSVEPNKVEEIFGVNDRVQLAQLERAYQLQQAEKLMRQGVTLCDPARIDIRGDVHVGRDVVIDVNVILEERVVIGDGCHIGANCILRNTVLGNHVEVKPNSLLDGAEIANDCSIGPFARIRPGTVLADHVHIGNFVEVKNSTLASGTKANHLTYLGDSEIGKKVNVGAGTITCNYDGVNKLKTIIGDNAFIGSNTELVAPVTIGEGATIGAGSTITSDAPAHKLTVARAKQVTIENWQRSEKIKS